MTSPFPPSALARLQATFVAVVLPRVLSHGRVCFRGVRCPHAREDAIQEMVALAWKWHVRLARQGKDAARFPTALASFAARAVRAGRRLARMDAAGDVLSPRAQQRRGFAVEGLPDCSAPSGNPLSDALRDNTQTPPDEQACFRIDFPRWLASLSDRHCRVAEDMMLGERTLDVAARHGMSAGRVSQLRREFRQGWRRFCGDDPSLV
jgi:hypothetical protein